MSDEKKIQVEYFFNLSFRTMHSALLLDSFFRLVYIASD